MKTVAVVVTYNRKALLKECLDAILGQTERVEKIIVVDNCSTDNTYEFLKEKSLLNNELIYYKRLDKNIGGAGGFYEGIKEAQLYNPDWVWIMDDDTIPNSSCLKELINAKDKINEKISFLASSVYGENGEFMNVPSVNLEKSESGYAGWYKYLSEGLVKIREATFVSLLINNDAIMKIGYPVKDYFIWGDDIEYTLRLNKYYGNAYMVGRSVAIHKRKINKKLSLLDEDNINRINFYYYMVRNNLINKKNYYGTKECIKYMFNFQLAIIKVLITPKCKMKFLKIKNVYKAFFAFIFKKYDINAFRNRFDVNVKYKK